MIQIYNQETIMREMLPEVKRLKKFKEDKEWSFERIGRSVGVSFATVRGWMREENPAKPNELALRSVRAFLENVGY